MQNLAEIKVCSDHKHLVTQHWYARQLQVSSTVFFRSINILLLTTGIYRMCLYKNAFPPGYRWLSKF